MKNLVILSSTNGIPHPVDPWRLLTARLMSTVVLLSVSTNMDAKEREQVVRLAADNLSSIAKSIVETELKQ